MRKRRDNGKDFMEHLHPFSIFFFFESNYEKCSFVSEVVSLEGSLAQVNERASFVVLTLDILRCFCFKRKNKFFTMSQNLNH